MDYLHTALEIAGAVSVICGALAHLSILPAKVQAACQAIGLFVGGLADLTPKAPKGDA